MCEAFEGLSWEVVINAVIVIPPGENALQHFISVPCLVLGNMENILCLSTSETALPTLNGEQCAFGGACNSQCSHEVTFLNWHGTGNITGYFESWLADGVLWFVYLFCKTRCHCITQASIPTF